MSRTDREGSAKHLELAAVRPSLLWLLPGLPPDEANDLVRAFAGDAAEVYRRRAIPPPSWVKEINR